jgi:hypothetical protein
MNLTGPRKLDWADTLYRVDAVRFVREQLAFDPDPAQQTVLASRAGRGILNCTRQWGKSTVTAAKAVHRAATWPDSLVVVMSPSGRQSGEFIDKVRRFVSHMGLKPRGDGHNQCSLALPNRSRIVGVPDVEATTRGFSGVSLLLVDEAAWVEDSAYQAMTAALAASDGDRWLMSTPGGRRGFFYDIWEHAPPGSWTRISVPATECPRISPSFLAGERCQKSAQRFEQEYMCSFIDMEGALFTAAVIDRAFTSDVLALYDPRFLNQAARQLPRERRIYVGLDLGKSPDRSAVAVVEWIKELTGARNPVTWEPTTLVAYAVTHVDQFREGMSYADVAAKVAALMNSELLGRNQPFCRRELVVDATGVGAAVVEMLSRALHSRYQPGGGCLMTKVVITGGETEGMHSGAWHVPKTNLMATLEVLLDGGALRISRGAPGAEVLRKQLRDLQALPARDGRSTRYGAPGRLHDDTALALALACWRARHIDGGEIGEQSHRLV